MPSQNIWTLKAWYVPFDIVGDSENKLKFSITLSWDISLIVSCPFQKNSAKTSTHCYSVIRDLPGLESLDLKPQTADVPPNRVVWVIIS